MKDQLEQETADPLWMEIRDRLVRWKREITDAIRNYPPPIPRCDLQFNHLLEEREKISAELSRLDALRGADLRRDRDAAAMAEFILSSTHIDDDAKEKLRRELDERSS
jgi:hypothetical protein